MKKLFVLAITLALVICMIPAVMAAEQNECYGEVPKV